MVIGFRVVQFMGSCRARNFKSALRYVYAGSGRVFSGFGILPKYGAGIGKTINVLTGSGIWLFPGKRNSLKIGHGMRDLCLRVCRECRKPLKTRVNSKYQLKGSTYILHLLAFVEIRLFNAFFWEKKSGIRETDEKRGGCGILAKKGREWGIRTPPSWPCIRAGPIWNYRPDYFLNYIVLHSVLLPSLIVETNFKAKPLQFAKKVRINSFCGCFNSKSGVNSANKNNCYCQRKYYPLIGVIVTLPQRKITSFWS